MTESTDAEKPVAEVNSPEIEWDLGALGRRKGLITPQAIALVEQFHGGIVGIARRNMSGLGGFAETVTIVWATVQAHEGKDAPDRDDIQKAVFEVGLGNVLTAAGEVCRRVLEGIKPEVVGLH